MAQSPFGPIPVQQFRPFAAAELGRRQEEFNALLPIRQKRVELSERRVDLAEQQIDRAAQAERAFQFGQMADTVLKADPADQPALYKAALQRSRAMLEPSEQKQFDEMQPKEFGPEARNFLMLARAEGNDARIEVARINARTESERLEVERERQENELIKTRMATEVAIRRVLTQAAGDEMGLLKEMIKNDLLTDEQKQRLTASLSLLQTEDGELDMSQLPDEEVGWLAQLLNFIGFGDDEKEDKGPTKTPLEAQTFGTQVNPQQGDKLFLFDEATGGINEVDEF